MEFFVTSMVVAEGTVDRPRPGGIVFILKNFCLLILYDSQFLFINPEWSAVMKKFFCPQTAVIYYYLFTMMDSEQLSELCISDLKWIGFA